MKHFWRWPATFILCAFWGSAFACPQAQLVDENGNIVRLLQRKFDGVYELVLLAGNATQQALKSRLTYDGTSDSACRFGAAAIAKGGTWGWHLAWADAHHVYVARMDGEAWVHVPPKRFALSSALSLKFQQSGSVLQLVVTNSQGIFSLYSDDEGRSWDIR